MNLVMITYLVTYARTIKVVSKKKNTSHNRTSSIRILIAKLSTSLVAEDRGMNRVVLVRRIVVAIVTMLVIVVRRTWDRCVVVDWPVAAMRVVEVTTVCTSASSAKERAVVRVKRKLP